MQSRVLVIGSGEEKEKEKEEEKKLKIAFRLLRGMPRSVSSQGVVQGER